MKGILKRIRGCLKYVAVALPVLVFAYGIGATVASTVEGTIKTEEIQAYYSSEAVQQVIEVELKEIDKAVDSNTMTFTEASDKYDEVKSDKYVRSVADKVYANDENYQGCVKALNRDIGLVISGTLGLAAGIFSGFMMYTGKENSTAANLIESANEDLFPHNYSMEMN